MKEKLNSLKPYVQAIKFSDDYNIVEMVIENGWIINKVDNIEVTPNDGIRDGFLLYSDKKEIDELLDYAGSIIKFNKEKEEIKRILDDKTIELKSLFNGISLENAKNVEIIIRD